eukprot:TRINITY_DN34607_c0_g1_i1.p1 TRINITY_DN34607_c0_g1~~TRINITY_DN34607_c0_g1_i1.p1  ORF type:complete len:288 (+),score=37.63 TRINITY_DN34607_c0_g1_i1:50-913(+)
MTAIPQSLVYGSARAVTRGGWNDLVVVKKGVHESVGEFTDARRPSLLRQDDSRVSLMVSKDPDFELPTMPKYLYHTLTTSRRVIPGNLKVNQFQGSGKGIRWGVADSTGFDQEVDEAMIKEGLTHGVFSWSAPMPRNLDEAAEVDEDWQKLTEAFANGGLGDQTMAVFTRGPFPIAYMKPKISTPRRSTREEYQFYVLTPDFRDIKTINEVHWALRQLGTTSNQNRWFNYYALYARYLRWNIPKYFCPATSGDVLTQTELARWTTREAPLPSSLGSHGYVKKNKIVP